MKLDSKLELDKNVDYTAPKWFRVGLSLDWY